MKIHFSEEVVKLLNSGRIEEENLNDAIKKYVNEIIAAGFSGKINHDKDTGRILNIGNIQLIAMAITEMKTIYIRTYDEIM